MLIYLYSKNFQLLPVFAKKMLTVSSAYFQELMLVN